MAETRSQKREPGKQELASSIELSMSIALADLDSRASFRLILPQPLSGNVVSPITSHSAPPCAMPSGMPYDPTRRALIAGAAISSLAAYGRRAAAAANVQTHHFSSNELGSVPPVLTSPDGSALIGFVVSGTGAIRRTVQDKLRDSISLADFGYAADGTDNTAVWQNAIAAALVEGVTRITVPDGVGVVAGSIVNGPLASGITFEAERPVRPDGTEGSIINYTGTGTCWDIQFPSIAASVGRWTWRGLGFKTTQGTATMFDFNRANEGRAIGDFDGWAGIEHVRFEGCYLEGPGLQSAAQTGDGIRGAKMFQLIVDENTFVRDFRHGIWLYGCDNCDIRVRGFLCGIEVKLEHPPIAPPNTSPLGNDNKVYPRFLGGSPAESALPAMYNIWDECNSTEIGPSLYEDNGGNRTAFFYLNGYGTTLLRPHFGGDKSFRLGPNARDILMLHPSGTGPATVTDAPIIDTPSSWDFGDPQNGNQITVVGANANIRDLFGVHPRIRYLASIGLSSGTGAVKQDQAMSASNSGYAPAQLMITALDTGGNVAPRLINGAIRVEDSNATNGWAMQLPGVGNGILFADFKVGEELLKCWYRVTIRQKRSDTATYLARIQKNGVDVQNLSTTAPTATYVLDEFALDLTGWAIDDSLRFLWKPAAGTANGSVEIDYIRFEPVSANIAFPAGGAIVDAEARAAIDSILVLLQAQGLMAP